MKLFKNDLDVFTNSKCSNIDEILLDLKRKKAICFTSQLLRKEFEKAAIAFVLGVSFDLVYFDNRERFLIVYFIPCWEGYSTLVLE